MSRRERLAEDDSYREWKGGYRSYDIVKEACIAFGVVLALAVVLTILFSSPDEKPSTVQSWARTDPVDFVTTATTELDGSSGTGGYGPPYNHASDGQHILFLRPQKWLGVSHPVDTAQDFVLAPLRAITGQPTLQAAVNAYESASADQQAKWTTAYENGLAKAKANADGSITLPAGSYGPVPAEDPDRMFEVPQFLNARHGVFVVENLDTSELARDGVREFALILTHPKLRGASGAWTSPIALV